MARAGKSERRGEEDRRRRQGGRRGRRFCIVVEGVMEEIAAERPGVVACPVIGIGASPSCDGQVLVTEDMLGLFERTPRFVKRYDDLASRPSTTSPRAAGPPQSASSTRSPNRAPTAIASPP
jgi:3-methyl-2-oxobutanoate hydroxymethyltransferase